MIYTRIRCIETTNEERVLWEKTKVVFKGDDEILGDSIRTFSISIPPSAAALARSTQHLKDYRVQWRFDVGLDHAPIPYVGNRIAKSFLINIYDHRVPRLAPPSPPNDITLGDITMSMTSPHGSFGPGDTIPCSYHAESSTSAAIRKITIVLERTVHITGQEPATTLIVTTSLSNPAPRRSIPLQLPSRGGKWELGESLMTPSASVSFHLRLRAVIKGSKPAQSPRVPVHITAVPAAERREPPSPQRIRRSARRGLYMHEGTTDIADPAVGLAEATPIPIIITSRLPLKPILLTTEPPYSLLVPGASKSLRLALPEEDKSMSILRRYQQNGRRISTTASEEEDMQPLRIRQKMKDENDVSSSETPPTPPVSEPSTPPLIPLLTALPCPA